MGIRGDSTTEPTVLWRRLDQPGHESARLSFRRSEWHLTGTAVFARGAQACRLDYEVICDAVWRTVSGRVTGWIGSRVIEVELTADASSRWHLNGIDCPAVAGC